MIGRRTYHGTYGRSEMLSHPGGTDARLHRRRHRTEVTMERIKRELAQIESNKEGIADTGDGSSPRQSETSAQS